MPGCRKYTYMLQIRGWYVLDLPPSQDAIVTNNGFRSGDWLPSLGASGMVLPGLAGLLLLVLGCFIPESPPGGWGVGDDDERVDRWFGFCGGILVSTPIFLWIFICQVLFLRWGCCFFNKNAVSELAKSTDSGFLKACPTGFWVGYPNLVDRVAASQRI